jgi:hypothetical protein
VIDAGDLVYYDELKEVTAWLQCCPANGKHQTTMSRTSILPRVAFEYGHTTCAFCAKDSASVRGIPGTETQLALIHRFISNYHLPRCMPPSTCKTSPVT